MDIRDTLFRPIASRRFAALLTAQRGGILSGTQATQALASQLDVELVWHRQEGDSFAAGDVLAQIRGCAKAIAQAEEQLIGAVAKFSGIASAAARAVELAAGRGRIVCGSWKKMPPCLKDGIRQAVVAGGASFRIAERPMIYMDKNYIRMLGSIPAALQAADAFPGHVKVVQIRGEVGRSVAEETRQALAGGCGILMVDTGREEDLQECSRVVRQADMRRQVEIAFAGGVRLERIAFLFEQDADVVCIGREIVDAPLLDCKLDVTEALEWA